MNDFPKLNIITLVWTGISTIEYWKSIPIFECWINFYIFDRFYSVWPEIYPSYKTVSSTIIYDYIFVGTHNNPYLI